MSDTETREARAWAERTGAEWARLMVDEWAAGRAEADRLRGVVEAVRALADEWAAWGCRSEEGHDGGDVQCLPCASVEIDRALASVPSSGETGEPTWANAYADPDQAHDSISPASPEPTGADDARESAVAAVCSLYDHDDLDGLDTFHASERIVAQVQPILAARPILSREAVRGRLDGHWPSVDGCFCGWARSSRTRTVEEDQDAWRDHLAAVLDTQEADCG